MSDENRAATAVSLQFVLIVAAVIALTGCALVIFGCAFEAQSQLDLLRVSGPAALDTYLARVGSHQLSFAALMVQSVTGSAAQAAVHAHEAGSFAAGRLRAGVFRLTNAGPGCRSGRRYQCRGACRLKAFFTFNPVGTLPTGAFLRFFSTRNAMKSKHDMYARTGAVTVSVRPATLRTARLRREEGCSR